jgi:hypothetical protein
VFPIACILSAVAGLGPFGSVQENPSAVLAAGSDLPHYVFEVARREFAAA